VRAYDSNFGYAVEIVLEDGETVARCESCFHPFAILEVDLVSCRELKALRKQRPGHVSPHAGEILCPMHADLMHSELIARRRLEGGRGKPTPRDIVDEFAGLPPGTNAALFLDWLRKHGGIV